MLYSIIQFIKDTLRIGRMVGAGRSSLWPKIRAAHIEKYPDCAVCRGNKKLEVHHKVPFHVNPELELNPENLITLCENKKNGINCHLLVGHLGSYRSWNESVVIDAEAWKIKLLQRPKY